MRMIASDSNPTQAFKCQFLRVQWPGTLEGSWSDSSSNPIRGTEQVLQSPLGGALGPRLRSVDARQQQRQTGQKRAVSVKSGRGDAVYILKFQAFWSLTQTSALTFPDIHGNLPNCVFLFSFPFFLHLLDGLGQYQFTPHSQSPQQHPLTYATLLC